jgi:hypothetical protein
MHQQFFLVVVCNLSFLYICGCSYAQQWQTYRHNRHNGEGPVCFQPNNTNSQTGLLSSGYLPFFSLLVLSGLQLCFDFFYKRAFSLKNKNIKKRLRNIPSHQTMWH